MPYKNKDEQRRYQRERRARLRSEWIEAHGPCANCGSSKDLQVDHKDPKTKVDHCVWSWSPVRREAELAKCQVLCVECHKAKSAEERKVPLIHGKDISYTHCGCRCEVCTDAHRVAKNEQRARRRSLGLTAK